MPVANSPLATLKESEIWRVIWCLVPGLQFVQNGAKRRMIGWHELSASSSCIIFVTREPSGSPRCVDQFGGESYRQHKMKYQTRRYRSKRHFQRSLALYLMPRFSLKKGKEGSDVLLGLFIVSAHITIIPWARVGYERLVFTSDGVVVGVVIRRVERYDLVKTKPTESEAEHWYCYCLRRLRSSEN